MRNLCACFAFLVLVAISSHGFGRPVPSTQDRPEYAKPVPPKPDKDGVYQVGPGIVSPGFVHAEPAAYPPGATKTDDPHGVLLSAVIGIDGRAKAPEVTRRYDIPMEDLAITAVRDSLFRPGTLDGSPVPVLVCIRVMFYRLWPAIPTLVTCSPAPGIGSSGDSNPQTPDPYRLPPGAKPPVAIHMPPAQFSAEASAEHFQSAVIVSTIVNEDGLPTDVRLVRGAGHGLDENAIAAVSQYRFQPATINGKPIATRITIEIDFKLK
ncbi:MAG: energy transducer TonB [Terracidiphilus sp.]|jgi:TonB family protein